MTPDTDALIAGLTPWIETESPTSAPDAVNAMMDMAAAEIASAGAQVERIAGEDGKADAVSARFGRGGNGPDILVLCHLDTVHPIGTLETFPVRIEGDKLYGPGSCDMKGGVYIAIQAARAVAEAGGGKLPVRFLLTPDEETGSHASRGLIEAAAEGAKYVLVPEPGRPNGAVVTARKGVSHYWLTTTGVAAHSGTAHDKGRSAVRAMARLILEVEAMTDYSRGLTLNVGQLRGGTTINTVPQECWAALDVRSEDEATQLEVHERIMALASSEPDVTLSITGGPNRPAYRKEAGIAALYDHAHALAADIGFALPDAATGGGSDGSFVAGRVPTLDGLGVVGADAHTHNEHLIISSMVPRLTLLRRLMETLE